MPDTTAESRMNVDTVIAAWNSHNPERIAACFAADAVYEDIPLGKAIHGTSALITHFTDLFHAFPDLAMTANRRVEQGENLVWEWILTGTHRNDFHGLPATNHQIQLRGVAFCVVQGGKIAEERKYWDMASFLKQVGLISP